MGRGRGRGHLRETRRGGRSARLKAAKGRALGKKERYFYILRGYVSPHMEGGGLFRQMAPNGLHFGGMSKAEER